jgi:hypothetical protein
MADVDSNVRYLGGGGGGSDSESGRSSPGLGRSKIDPTGLPAAQAASGPKDEMDLLLRQLDNARLNEEDTKEIEAEILTLEREIAERDAAAAAIQAKKAAAAVEAARTAAANVPPAPAALSEIENQLIRMIKTLQVEIKRTPECVSFADELGMGYKTDRAFNIAQKVDDKLTNLAIENVLLPTEKDLWDEAAEIVVRIIDAKGHKKRDSSTRMPTIDLARFRWSGNPADLPNFLQTIETLLVKYDVTARYNYLHQCLSPQDKHLIEHTVSYQEAIEVLESMQVSATAELEKLHQAMTEMPICKSEAAQVSTIAVILKKLHKGVVLDPNWPISLQAGMTILRVLYNDGDIREYTAKLKARHAVLQKELDGGFTDRVKRNGMASVTRILIELLTELRNLSTERETSIISKSKAIGRTGEKDLYVQKMEVSGRQQGPKPSMKVRGEATSVHVVHICDLCDSKTHGLTRFCYQLDDYCGRAAQLPEHICPLHLGRKGPQCASRKCDDYLDKSGKSKNGLCTVRDPPVNFRICGCDSCIARAASFKQKYQMRKNAKAAKKEKKKDAKDLWPAPGVPKAGKYVGGGPSAKVRQNKVEVRSIEVNVECHDRELEVNACTVNGVPIGSPICPSEILRIPNASGGFTEILACYDSHSQATFFDPELLKHCTSIRDTGDEAIVIKTFSGDSESANRQIGSLQIPVEGGESMLIEGLAVETKKKMGSKLPWLPTILFKMRQAGTLAAEPKQGIHYPVILFGADVCSSVFPHTVYKGDQAFNVNGYSLLKSKITSRYIPTGAYKAPTNEEKITEAWEVKTDDQNKEDRDIESLLTNLTLAPGPKCSNPHTSCRDRNNKAEKTSGCNKENHSPCVEVLKINIDDNSPFCGRSHPTLLK